MEIFKLSTRLLIKSWVVFVILWLSYSIFIGTTAGQPLVISADQVKQLNAPDGQAGDEFGQSVAISGDYLVIGAHLAEVDGQGEQGAVYIYKKSPVGTHNWSWVKTLTADDGSAGDHFGRSVDIDGDLLIVGAHQADLIPGNPLNQNHGVAYVFQKDGGDDWGLVKKIFATDWQSGANFGWSVAIDGSTALVGAYLVNFGDDKDQGAAYLFEKDSGGPDNWGEIKKLEAADGEMGDYFGYAVDLEGETAVVGAQLVDFSPFTDQGAVYVFGQNKDGPDNWGLVKKLSASDGLQREHFGTSVSLSGDTIAVGAYWADNATELDQGAVYIYDRNRNGTDNWGEAKKILAGDGLGGDHFGWSVHLLGDNLLVGAPEATISTQSGRGAAYLFDRTDGGSNGWGQIDKLFSQTGEDNDNFGSAVSFAADTYLIGAKGATVSEKTAQGTAYLFSDTPDTFVNRLYLPFTEAP
ncbi:MAG: FG-GAP repeat protein [Ardenticatenaceae bacterium]|nr:FG-GAP repeat protein [Ardenticatenaceae bacterium]